MSIENLELKCIPCIPCYHMLIADTNTITILLECDSKFQMFNIFYHFYFRINILTLQSPRVAFISVSLNHSWILNLWKKSNYSSKFTTQHYLCWYIMVRSYCRIQHIDLLPGVIHGICLRVLKCTLYYSPIRHTESIPHMCVL